jgi:hypothetical protein
MLWLVNLICRLNKNFTLFLKRRASSSAAVASTANKSVPQKKSGQFGIPQRLNLPKESINVR